jgi:hypothetical protein
MNQPTRAEHVALLKQDVTAWNAWRDENRKIRPNLLKANLSTADLAGANLSRANLRQAFLRGADLTGANLSQTTLSGASLLQANLLDANLSGTTLIGAQLMRSNLAGAFLHAANLNRANLTGANLTGANLVSASLMEANLTGADLTGCHIYGVSAWGLKLGRAKQQNLVITAGGDPEITVDNIEVAQFIYLMLNNRKVRDVLDTITSKVVLILGRFTDERKAVLDALREELRKRNYLPILFDFEVPTTRDITETISLLVTTSRHGPLRSGRHNGC